MAKKQQKINTNILKKLIQDEFGVPAETEHMFHDKRKWRIDLAVWGKNGKIAIELEGGVWTKGRHTHPSGFLKDIDKYNSLSIYNWRLLRYTHSNHQYHHILSDLKLLL